MRLFSRFLLCFLILVAAAWVILPWRFYSAYPRALGPELDDRIRTSFKEKLDETQARIVLLGDSGLKDSVDPALFEQSTGQKTLYLAIPGSSSAQWYLILKNNLVKAEHKPDAVVILFRDTALTTPDFRVTGKYFLQIDELAGPLDTELIDRAYVRPMNPVERLAERYFPLYAERKNVRDTVDYLLKYTLPYSLTGCGVDCQDRAQAETFAEDKLDASIQRFAVEEAESYLYSYHNLNFQARVQDSFLPLIIQLARENHIRLVLVRAHTAYEDGLPLEYAPLVESYASAMRAYLSEQGVNYISFANDDRIDPSDFKDSVHMNSRGQKNFTPLFADAIMEVLAHNPE